MNTVITIALMEMGDCDDLSKLTAYLKTEFNSCILIPAKHGGKVPIVSHKDGQYTWELWDSQGAQHVSQKIGEVDGCLIRLSEGVIVIDVDDNDIAYTLEQQELGFERTVACQTNKGRHYYFRRTPACDYAGMYDGARQFGDIDIDIKTCNLPGKCPGLISVPPSPNKQWLRPPWDHVMLPMPDKFIDFYIEKSSKKTKTIHATLNLSNSVFVQLHTLRNIVLHLLAPSRAATYDNWLAVVFAINNICNESGHSNEERNKLIHEFSKRWPSKYDAKRVDAAIRALVPLPNGKRLGTLGAMAKEDSPDAWRRELTQYIFPADNVLDNEKTSPGDDEIADGNHKHILNHADVKCAVDAILLALNLDSTTVIVKQAYINTSRALQLDVNYQGRDSTIALNLESLEIQCDGKPTGFLHNIETNGIPVVNFDLMCFDRHFRPGMQWKTFRPCEENLKFTTNGEFSAQIDLVNYNNPSARSARINLPGLNKYSTVVAPKKISMLLDAYSESVKHAISNQLGLGNVLIVMDNRIQIQQHNQYLAHKEQDRHTDEELIEALLLHKEDFQTRWKFSPDVKSANSNGLFHCIPITNRWQQVHNAYVENQIVQAFKSIPTLTEGDRRYVNSCRGGMEMRKMLVRKVLHDDFHLLLDGNLDVFAVANGAFDMKTKEFRPLQPEDMVMTHASWSYDAEQAKTKRPEVELFLSQVLPVPNERRVFLCYMANLMSGRRTAKRFIAMTDRRAGNNGKSTLARLFTLFFSNYAETNTKFVCKGSFDRDRDSHDAGLEPFKGKRLLVAEELKKSMTLDDAMLKAYTGGAGMYVRGRKCGSGERFGFVWQAGFLLIFNENDAPKFDYSDEAFITRMVVTPMRSKFVSVDSHGFHPELDEPYTYPMDANLDMRFAGWLPALAAILLDHYDANGLDFIPDSMKEWRSDITSANNTISDWLNENIVHTGNKKDCITLTELYKHYCDSMSSLEFAGQVRKSEFEEMIRSFCATRRDDGVVFKASHDIKQSCGKFKTFKKVVVGVAFLDAIDT